MTDAPSFRAMRRAELDGPMLVDGLTSAPNVVIAIPVFNGGSVVRECLQSVVIHSGGIRIVVIDDCSTDVETIAILDEFVATGRIELVRHAENWGYTRTVNQAAALAGELDVILLNSDTVVGPLWAQRLRWSAYSHPDIASASAVSDNAGAMSMPKIGTFNRWAPHLQWSEIARFVARTSTTLTVDTPTAHGFCVYLRRDALRLVGGFDEAEFPRGYGEENDWSMRALGAGLRNVVAPHVMVRHAQGHSFGSSRDELIKTARVRVDALHPNYRPFVGQWVNSPEMATVREAASSQQERVDECIEVLPTVLYVLHASGGGTPATNRDLMGALQTSQESLLLLARTNMVELLRWDEGGGSVLETWKPSRPFTVRDTWRRDYGEVLVGWLAKYGVELIHIRHLIDQPLTTVPEAAKLLGIPVVLSTHDFYYVCPTVHLLDNNAVFCGGVCTPGAGHCVAPSRFVANIPNLKHDWVYEWRQRVASVMDSSARIIATTRSAGEVYTNNFPQFESKLTIIEHGRDLESGWAELRADRERRPGPLRVACPANWQLHKGTEYLRDAIEQTGNVVEWHILGANADQFSDVAVVHGTYTRDGMREVFDEIDPDYVGLFSIWAETYSHTLTEAWALGIPVLATDIGAVADRIKDFGGGRLFPVESPNTVANFLREEGFRSLERPHVLEPVDRDSVRSEVSMAEDYAALYSDVRSSMPAPSIGYSVRGGRGRHPGSAHVRVLRRLANLRATGDAHFRPIDLGDYARGSDATRYQSILVQRDSVDPGLVDAVIARVRRDGTELVVELDDDLVSDEAIVRLVAQGYARAALDGLARLISEADITLVSTPALATMVSGLAHRGRVVVSENALDARLWESAVAVQPADDPDGVVRVLYMGSPTHSEDLALLRGVFTDLTTTDGRRVVLEVIGVSTENDDWYERLVIPPRLRNYPQFVRWLRERRNRWAFGVAPLTDTSFNWSKSDIKFLEYSMLGLPTVASAVGPYSTIPEHGGRLVENTEAQWRATILEFAENDVLREESAAVARDYTASKRMLQSPGQLDQWASTIGLTTTQS